MKTPGIICILLALFIAAPVITASGAEHVISVPTREEFNPVDIIKAREKAHEVPELITRVLDESPYERRKSLLDKNIGIRDVRHTFFLLDSPIIKDEHQDYYEPVRFMHGKHISLVEGDCSKCHHLRPADPDLPENVSCSSCHQKAFDPEKPDRIGLKAAYHLQCMGCHEEMQQGPVDCLGCHGHNVPDHAELVKLESDPRPWEVTEECLRCHAKQGQDILHSAHWLWRGPSPYTVKHTKEDTCGKATNAVNNF
ncbi:MAG: cytochrome c3 family protein [Desulfonatronovibrionaceae bacterium]